MMTVTSDEASSHFRDLLVRVLRGETILIEDNASPLAELRPVPSRPNNPRIVGLHRGLFSVPASFFEPLSDDELDLYSGE